MSSTILFSPLGGLAFSQAAGDAYLAQFLNPVHLDPVSAADPYRSHFILVSGGGEDGGGDGKRDRLNFDFSHSKLDSESAFRFLAGQLEIQCLENGPVPEPLLDWLRQGLRMLTPREQVIEI